MATATTTAPQVRTVQDTERYLFDCHGYVVVPDVLEAGQVAALLEVVHARFDASTGQQPERTSFSDSQILACDKAFIDLIDWPAIAPYLEAWLGPGYRLDHEYAMLFKPRCGKGGAFHIHGGGTPFRPGQLYSCHNGAIHSGETVVSYALTDINPGDGGLGVVPGSHKANFALPWAASPGPYPEDVVRAVPVRAGSAIIFTEALTHCSLPWMGAQERVSLFYKYTPRTTQIARRVPNFEALARLGISAAQRAILEPGHS